MSVRTLVLCDDPWHPPQTVRRGLMALGNCDFVFEYLTDGAAWSSSRMEEFRVVILAKANIASSTNPRPWLTTETQHAFADYLRAGNGLFVVHSGTSGYDQLPVMLHTTGGAFVRHPDPCAVTVDPTNGHALTAGVTSFTIQDEHYVMTLEARDAHVFLHSRSGHGLQPAGWTRTEGQGRVCVLTPGHNVEVWLHPGFQTLLRNGLHWLAKLN